MNVYPYRFEPIYKETIWGGRNLERLFGRNLPPGRAIGESWELADMPDDASVVSNGPLAGKTLTQLVRSMGKTLLGGARPTAEGRFPLLLKLLDANDILSLQVHPDGRTAAAMGGDVASKSECWYVIESRGGFIYKGIKPGVTPREFRRAVETDAVRNLVRQVDVSAGDFHYLPAGTVHALGKGVVIAEVQTPSKTTFRVTDWGRGREIQPELSMRCIHFQPASDRAPGADGETLLACEFFTVSIRRSKGAAPTPLPEGQCWAMMMLSGTEPIHIRHAGKVEAGVSVRPGDTVLAPAGLRGPELLAAGPCSWLEILLPEGER